MHLARHLLAASAVLLVSLSAAQAWACSCKPGGPTRAQIVSSAKYVFFGTATDLGEKKGDMTISIDEMLKGDAGGRDVAKLKRDTKGAGCEGVVPYKVGTTFLFVTSDLDAMKSFICRKTIFPMKSAPDDLNVWAGITSPEPEPEREVDVEVPTGDVDVDIEAPAKGDVDIEAPTKGDLDVDVEKPVSGDLSVDVESPAGDLDVEVEGGTEEKPADATKATPRERADDQGSEEPTTSKPASGGCASTSSSAGVEPGGPVNAAFAFGVLLLGVGVRRRLR